MKKIFTKSEILSEDNFYLIKKRKKLAVYVPASHLEKVFSEMSKAGAGIIGNYDNCSFRINGTGTFRPSKKAKPFSGKKNRISFESEIRLETECSPDNLAGIIEAMLRAHPYEETAYEIYDFVKLDTKISGKLYTLKRKKPITGLLKRLNQKLKSETGIIETSVKKILVTNNSYDNILEESAQYFNIELIIILKGNVFKLIKI
ncbi:MAG: hypothetical protein IPM38_02660 [Ignavibacteria bacterium]|nr:hypothetical protein [Ignavibacteria bacterium]